MHRTTCRKQKKNNTHRGSADIPCSTELGRRSSPSIFSHHAIIAFLSPCIHVLEKFWLRVVTKILYKHPSTPPTFKTHLLLSHLEQTHPQVLLPAMTSHPHQFWGTSIPYDPYRTLLDQLIKGATLREEVMRGLSSELTDHRKQLIKLKGETNALRMERSNLRYDIRMLSQRIERLEHKPLPKRRWWPKKKKRHSAQQSLNKSFQLALSLFPVFPFQCFCFLSSM